MIGRHTKKFNMLELRETIVVNPFMVEELLSSLSMLSAQAELPLIKYTIQTSIHAPYTKAYIFDKNCEKIIINFSQFPDQEDEES